MKLTKMLVMLSIGLLLASSATVSAGAGMTEEQWKQTLNYMAETDPVGFRTKLATRFKINEAQLDTVFASVDSPADVFMVLSYANNSGKSIDYVIERYRAEKGDWTAIAKSLGMKVKD